MKLFDYLAAFYAEKHTPDKFVGALDSLLNAEPATVRAIPFGCQEATMDWLDGGTYGERKAKLLYRQDTLLAFRLDYTFVEKGQEKKDSGRFFILQQPDYPNVFVAFSLESTQFFRRALLPLFQGLHPRVMLTFLKHSKMKHLLDTFKTEGGYTDLIVTRTSQRLRYTEGNKKRIMPVVSWPDTSLDEAFQWIEDHNGWFQSLEFEVLQKDRPLATLTLTRQGILRATALFKRAYQTFLIPTSKTLANNLKLFSHRARLDRPDSSAKPLAIDFETDQFEDKEQNRRLIQAMRRLSGASVSVLHGNPYVHLSVLDYHDGSSFDLWVLDRRQIVIVPQLKASIAGVKRLINHIFDDYAEGRLLDYTPPQT